MRRRAASGTRTATDRERPAGGSRGARWAATIVRVAFRCLHEEPVGPRVGPALASISVRSEAASPSSSARSVKSAGGPMVAPVAFARGGITAGPRVAASGTGGF